MRVSVLRRLIAASVIVYTIAGVWIFSSTHQTASNFVIPTLAVLGNTLVNPTAIPDTSVVIAQEDTALRVNVQPVSAEVNPSGSNPQAALAVATVYPASADNTTSTGETVAIPSQASIVQNPEMVTVLDTTYQTNTETLQSAVVSDTSVVTGANNPPPNAVAPAFRGGGRVLVSTNNPVIAVDDQCSLIEAIENANADSAIHSDCPAGLGTDTIRLEADSVHTLTAVHNITDGANGLPSITSPIIIEGNDATIERYELSPEPTYFYRIFHIAATGNLTLNNITIQRGRIDGGYGAGLYNAGSLTLNNTTVKENRFYEEVTGYGTGIYNIGTLTLNSSTISENIATESGQGAGIYNTGILTLNSSTISSNRIHDRGYGAGIYNTGTLTVTASNIAQNFAGDSRGTGGGIYNTGILTVTASLLEGNGTGEDGSGGGIYTTGTATVVDAQFVSNSTGGGGAVTNSGTLTITDSLIDDNYARFHGGGLWNSGTLTLTNTPVTSNGTSRNWGGGIVNTNSGILVITEGLIQGNRSNQYRAGALYSMGSLHIENTIIDDNSNPEAGSIIVGGETVMVNSHITNNRIGGAGLGAAIQIVGSANVTLNQVTISNNSYYGGAAVYHSGTGLLTIQNSVIASNHSINGDSAGVQGGNMVITNTTIYGNSSEHGASRALYLNSGSATIQFSTIVQHGIDTITVDGSSTVIVHNSIIADGNCIGTNINATGTNFTTTNCATYDTDFVTVTAEQLDLQALADNGGTVETMLPGANSVVLDTAICTLSDGTLLTVDARGEARPQGNGCEAGAVEVAFSCAECVDTQPPVTTIMLTPAAPDGLNGWYITPVTVSLSAQDNPSGSGVAVMEWSSDGGRTWQVFTDAWTISATEEITVLARAIDNAGNIESPPVASVIRIDTIAPTIDITTDRTTYTRLDDVLISITAADIGSGVASINADFNGLAVSDGNIVDLFNVAAGVITYSATVTDKAGWTATDNGQIEIVVTLDSLLALVDYLWEQGFITNQGIDNSLRQKIEGAIDAEVRGQPHVVLNKLSALLHEVQAQGGQHITSEAVQVLEEDIMAVMLAYGNTAAVSNVDETLNLALLTPIAPLEVATTEAIEGMPVVTETVVAVTETVEAPSATPEPTATIMPTDIPTVEPTTVSVNEVTETATPE